jgi:hypothetical protein
VHRSRSRPVAGRLVGGPDARAGWKSSPSMGQRSPVDGPVTAVIGKQRHARSGGKVEPQPGRGEEHHVALADHDAPVSGPRDQRVKHGKLVVEPCAGEADGEHERHVQMPERLVEIRAVLFGDLVDPCRARRPEGAARPNRDRRSRQRARSPRQGRIRAAIDRDERRSNGQRRLQIRVPERPAPDQSDRLSGPETTGCSGVFFWSSTATISIEWPYSRRVLLESSWSGQQQSDTVR